MNNDTLRKLEAYLKFKREYSPGFIGSEVAQNLFSELKKLRSDSAKSTERLPLKHSLSSGAEDGVIERAEVEKLPLHSEDWSACGNLEEFAAAISNCMKCSALAERRKQVVFGSGNPDADIVVVGEAPGADEDEQGFPFVGRAGKLLTDILAAINLKREEIYICNILKCRPPENRNPQPDEIRNCEPYLARQLELIKPKLILALGTFAAQTLLRTKEPLGKLRGKFHSYKNIKLMVTFHPAALLRNPNWKRPTWEDVQLFRKEYDRMLTGNNLNK